MAWASSLPTVLPALVARFRFAPELEGVKVYDGAALSGSRPAAALTVGWMGEGDATAAEGQNTRDGLAADRSRESYTVHCRLEVLNGGGDIIKTRDRLFQLFNGCGAALAADPLLGGAVMSVQLGAWSLSQAQSTAGALLILVFGIDVEADARRP